jgi:hypothetical protein
MMTAAVLTRIQRQTLHALVRRGAICQARGQRPGLAAGQPVAVALSPAGLRELAALGLVERGRARCDGASRAIYWATQAGLAVESREGAP